MKRKEYATREERMRDRQLGALVFCAGNVLVFLAYTIAQDRLRILGPALAAAELAQYRRYLQLLPWVANGLIFLVSLLVRPEVAVGYLACFGTILTGLIALAVLFFASCVVAAFTGALIGPLAIIVFAILFIAGLVPMVKIVADLVQTWWSAAPRERDG